MNAFYRRELNSQFNGLTGYVYCAFMLLIAGLFVVLISLQGEPRFEAIIYYMRLYFVPVIAVPILTMRSIAEERHQKTDKLLYSLPVSMTKIVLGKYLAIVTVMLIPMVLLLIYPYFLSALASSGTVPYGAAIGSVVMFALMCAAFAAICLFLSSLTEHVALAIAMSVGVGILLYFMSFLENYVSSEALAGFLTVTVFVILLALIFERMTKNTLFSFGVGAVLEIALLCAYLFGGSSAFTGLCGSIVGALALFSPFDSVANELFDWTAAVYYLSVIAVFFFLTVQSLEKRRWS